MKIRKRLLKDNALEGKVVFAILFITTILVSLSGCKGKEPGSDTAKLPDWKTQVDGRISEFGHRNWILIVDKAFPAQNTDGVITIDTKENLQDVLSFTLQQIGASKHVKPIVYTDREFAYLNAEQVRAIDKYRQVRAGILEKYNPRVLLHDSVFVKIDRASKLFKVLVLKTNEVIPYSSVFIELDCKYWSSEKEKALRDAMK
jgi:D-ribose pyranose/furanose isomerase RbsD